MLLYLKPLCPLITKHEMFLWSCFWSVWFSCAFDFPIFGFGTVIFGEREDDDTFALVKAYESVCLALTFCFFLIQTDVQKILRNARKLPEKTQTFYKVVVKTCLILSIWLFWLGCFKLILHFKMLLGAEPSEESCIGVWILGTPEGGSWPAGPRVHPPARLGPPRRCLPALSCCTTTQTGQHWWFPVRSLWSQHRSDAHRLL